MEILSMLQIYNDSIDHHRPKPVNLDHHPILEFSSDMNHQMDGVKAKTQVFFPWWQCTIKPYEHLKLIDHPKWDIVDTL